jgi:hypothetical protein
VRHRNLWIAIALVVGSVGARAQWINHPSPRTPRTKDGKPNLLAAAPRATDGKPDLSGVWLAESAPREELVRFLGPTAMNLLGEFAPSRYFMNALGDYKPDDIVLTPAAGEVFRQRGATFGKDMPSTHCLPLGIPLMDAAVFPHKIVQAPGLIIVLYEELTMFRQIYTDGRKLPENPEPTALGYSVGKWEGDALVVNVSGFSDQGWLDAFGHPHSDAMKVTERFHRRDFGHMDVQVTVDDAKTYSRPFTYKFTKQLMPDTDLIDSFCSNEKDRVHLR